MRIRLRIAVSLAGLLAFVATLLLLLPQFVHMASVKEKAMAILSEKTGLSIRAKAIDLSFLPRPSVTLRAGSLSGPVSGTFDAITVSPGILPLLLAKVRIARVEVRGADMRVPMPGRLGSTAGKEKFSLKTAADALDRTVSQVYARAPGLVVSIKKGRFIAFSGEGQPFQLSSVDARLGFVRNRVTVAVSCSSNVWSGASAAGWLNPGDFKGQVELKITQLRPAGLGEHLLPFMNMRIREGSADFSLDAAADGRDRLSAQFESHVDHLTFQGANQLLAFQQVRVKGVFGRHKNKTTLSLIDFNSLYPAARMSGELVLDRESEHARAAISAQAFDVAGVRKVALFFAGDRREVQKALDVVREGQASGVRVSAEGDSVRALIRKEAISARGRVVGARVMVPEIALEVEDARGDVAVDRGVLEASNLSGTVGKSRGTKGRFRFAMTHDAPRRLDIDVTADIAQLPFHLKRLVHDPAFIAEMEKIKSPAGRAEGHLTIVDSRQMKTQVVVDASSFSLAADYERFPYRMQVVGGGFHYDRAAHQVGVRGISGKGGASSFSDLSATLVTGQVPHLSVTSGKAEVVLDEIYPWLGSIEPMRAHLKQVGRAAGTMRLGSIALSGPLVEPKQWQFRVAGEVRDVAVESSTLPGPVALKSGGFDIQPDTISFSHVDARALDGSVRISGQVFRYLKGAERIELTGEGEIGDRSSAYLADLIRLPQEVRVRPPVVLRKTSIRWQRGSMISFSSDLKPQNGPLVSVNLASRPGEFIVRPLIIMDSGSRATFGFHLRKRELNIAFEGNLRAMTLDALLIQNKLFKGWMEGNFSADVQLDQPSRSTARGILEGAGLTIPWDPHESAEIQEFHVKAEEESASVVADITTMGHRMKVDGKVATKRDAFALDLDVGMDGLDLERVIARMRGKKRPEEALRDLSVEGTLRVALRYVGYGKYVWKPFLADIAFSRGDVEVLVREASVCGINTPGRIEYHNGDWSLRFVVGSKQEAVAPVSACLFGREDFTGMFGMSGQVRARGRTVEDLLRSLQGTATFAVKNGRMYRYTTLAKILEIASPTVIYRIPDLTRNGFPYDSAEATVEIRDGKLVIDSGLLNSPSADLIWRGTVDLRNHKVDGVVLVVPFTTVNRVVRAIPMIRSVFNARFLAIPVRISGDLQRPTVTPLSPSAIGSELIDMVRSIFGFPLKIVESIRP